MKDITIELMETMFSVLRLMKGEMAENNLTHLSMMQIGALFFLKFHDNIPMSDIADHFHIELPSATSLMNKLCEQKLVKRSEDPKDRRVVRISLTGKGKKLLEKAMRHRKKKMKKMLSYLSEKEKIDLLHIFKTLSVKLQKKNES